MSALTDVLGKIAPTIATALGGPLAGAAVSFLSSKLGVDPATVEQTVAGMTPDQLVKMKELDDQFQIEMAKNGIQLQLAQIDVNKAEAASTNMFIAGWRPATGWICALSFGYAAMIGPVFHLPVPDTALLTQVLLGMLGLAGMRSYEKANKAEGNR